MSLALLLSSLAMAGEPVSDQGLVDIVEVACARYPDEVRVVVRGSARDVKGLVRTTCADVRRSGGEIDVRTVVPWHARHARCLVHVEPYGDGWWLHAFCGSDAPRLTVVAPEPPRQPRPRELVDDQGFVDAVAGACDRPRGDVRVVVAGPAREVREILDDTCARVRRVHHGATSGWVHQWQARRGRCVFFMKPGESRWRVRHWCHSAAPPVYRWSSYWSEDREILYRRESARPPARTKGGPSDAGKGR